MSSTVAEPPRSAHASGGPEPNRSLHSNRHMYNAAHARNTLEHNCARFAVTDLGVKRRTESGISGT